MNKTIKKLMAFALAGAMTFGMGVPALAATDTASSYTNSGTEVTADTAKINLIKDYVRGADTETDSTSPAENFVFTITPYGVWNAGSSTGQADGPAYNTGNMPALAQQTAGVTAVGQTNTVTIEAPAGQAGDVQNAKTELSLSTYHSVGDFWYKVTEKMAGTTGVFYGTNDSQTENIQVANGNHNAVYYLHVQVVNNPDYDADKTDSVKFFRSVTLHKTPPVIAGSTDVPSTNVQYNTWAADNNYAAGVKVNDIQNAYYAGDLAVRKEVTGNAGDKEKRFEVTVTFTKPAGTVITSDITYSAVTSATGTKQTAQTIYNQKADAAQSGWKTEAGGSVAVGADATTAAYAQVHIYIKDGETVTFKNIPYGVTYKVAETKPTDDTYTNKLVFESPDTATTFAHLALGADTGKYATDADGAKTTGDYFGDANAATGAISDASDVLVITNERNTSIDIGVLTSNAPYIAILIIAGAVAVIYVKLRKGMIGE